MRVIAGKARGHKLHTLKGDQTRPTQDRVRESLFNILTPYISGARVLDLFAGSGALAIEALSRGAESAVLVEKSPAAARVIQRNLHATRLAGDARLRVGDAFRELERLAAEGASFDLIFADPPYELGLAPKTLHSVSRSGVLAPGGFLVVEHARKEELDSTMENLQLIRQKRYGDTMISFFRRSGGEPSPSPRA